MSTLWNTPRGEKLFRISLVGGLDDPDAREFPTLEEQQELIEAEAELMAAASPEQTRDLVTTATAFLKSRGTTVHEFSSQAIARVRGQVPIRSTRISLAPNGESLNLATATSSEETMEEYVGRIAAEEGAWDFASVDAVIEADDMDDATSISVDRFSADSGGYLDSTNTLYWPDGRSAEFDTTDTGFWVHDYLFVMNLLAVEQRLS